VIGMKKHSSAINKKASKRRELQTYTTSAPLKFDIKKIEKFDRADIEFHGVDHSGVSYEGRVFLNNPRANAKTPKTLEYGYVGSYHIFGHGGCFGDIGHCDVVKQNRHYDFRPEHPLTAGFKRFIITDQLRELCKKYSEFTVTVVPIVNTDRKMKSMDLTNIIKFGKIAIVTYES